MYSEPTTGTVPIHLQIADDIRARIASGELAPGDQLPTIDELSRQWHCAPGVARAARDVLKAEGLISTGRGKAAVVREPPRRIRLSLDWTQRQKDLVLCPKSERAKTGGIELTTGISLDETILTHRYEIVPADADLAKELGIAQGTELQRRTYELTERMTGYRLAFSISYIPKFLIESNPDLLDETKEPWPGGHQHQLYTVGIEIDRFVRTVTAIQPSPGTRQKWQMEPGVPIQCVRSRSIDTDGRVVEVSDATYPADRTEIEFTEQLTRWPKDYPRYTCDSS